MPTTSPQDATIAAYAEDAAAYRDATASLNQHTARLADAFAAGLPAGARVLEVGSGGGRDALALEQRGLSVRRTDITPAFVELLRAAGHSADLLDPLHDDLTDPGRESPYDGVWASACLLHVARADLPTVLRRLAAATTPDGLLHLSLKEGDGEQWSTHGSIAGARHFTYWREAPLRAVLDEVGWTVQDVGRYESANGTDWLDAFASRR
ncbi:class I SAM-dependent methyltransferase [Nocardioides speluncae]|uniref:class I SAM-dependent methyltransferase n=1 Tax=Nocardioides speluncae TaxID=2670337 RepID=UPI001F0C9B33|nr:class I SAM-dependent methyltransferase [Nocardioides speluncae]